MKFFFKRLFYFFCIPLALFGIVMFIYYYIQMNAVNENLRKISEFECIVMGDSQLQRLKPELFNAKTFNFASSGEHYYFTYQKIQKLLKNKNQSIKRIIMGASLANFAPAYIRLFDLNFPEGQNSLERYLYFLKLNEIPFLELQDILDKNIFESIVKGVYQKPDWGGLIISKAKKPDTLTINKVYRMHYRIKKYENLVSLEQIKYLNKIQKLCDENRIELYLVSGPIHDMYKSKVDSIYYSTLANVLMNLKSVEYINFLDEKIDPNLLSDPIHLNSEGADVYTRKISDSIDNYSNLKLNE